MIELPYLLRHENIARIEGDRFLIGDRRVFPFERRFELCSTIEEIAQALSAMVSQGGGPLEVALRAMVYVRDGIRRGRMPLDLSTFTHAAQLLIAARPTNTTMQRTLLSLLEEFHTLEEIMEDIERAVDDLLASFAQLYHAMGSLGSTLLGPKNAVLTTCFAEHTLLLSLAYAQKEGKEVVVYVNETRPYLQGSRLTAPSLEEMGISATVIGDGMGANLISQGMITHFMSACDLLCMDGTVVNKTTSLANAVAAHHWGIPYHVFSISPDPTKKGSDDLVIEERPALEMKRCGTEPTTLETIGAYYPAFDIIAPQLVTSVVTPKGIYTPKEIKGVFG
jgi:methylthioribose-1-phosphate isomerase